MTQETYPQMQRRHQAERISLIEGQIKAGLNVAQIARKLHWPRKSLQLWCEDNLVELPKIKRGWECDGVPKERITKGFFEKVPPLEDRICSDVGMEILHQIDKLNRSLISPDRNRLCAGKRNKNLAYSALSGLEDLGYVKMLNGSSHNPTFALTEAGKEKLAAHG